MAVTARPGREHIPGHPRVFIAVRFIQLVLGLVVLALDAYGLYRLAFSGDSLMMFTVSPSKSGESSTCYS